MKKTITLLLVLLISLSLFGCSSGPSKAVDNYISDIKTNAKEKISDYVDESVNDTTGILNSLVTDYIYDLIVDFDYSLSNETIDGDKASVDVNIKAYNLGSLLLKVTTSYLSWVLENMFTELTEEQQKDQLILLVTDAVKETKKEGKVIETTISVNLNKVDGKWIVDEDFIKNNIIDAITGGMKSALENIASQFSN